jgi:hypothetical protein
MGGKSPKLNLYGINQLFTGQLMLWGFLWDCVRLGVLSSVLPNQISLKPRNLNLLILLRLPPLGAGSACVGLKACFRTRPQAGTLAFNTAKAEPNVINLRTHIAIL